MHVELSRLGLTDGQAYPIDFFLMERQTSGSHCRITTTLELDEASPDPPLISAPFD